MAEEGGDTPYIVLQHPSGSKIYVVGTAHVSRKAAQDVAALIERVSPAAVVLELDEGRERKMLEQEQQGDKFGVRKLQGKSKWQIVKMSFTGEAFPYFMATIYTITGAVMGTTPGGEFLAADTAARSAGAQVVLADRDQDVTLQRLQYYTAALTRQDSRRKADSQRLRRVMDQSVEAEGRGGVPGGFPTDTAPSAGGMPGILSRPDALPSAREEEAAEEVRAAQTPDDPWGLGPEANSEEGMKRRLTEMMKEGGCLRPNAVLEAAKRLFKAGMDPKGSIDPTDVLAVRECGESLVETFRQRAIKGDDTWLQRLEREQVAGAKGAAGMERSNLAIQKVIVDERDLILARRLWEAGEAASPLPVVGVVGAGHIKGIQRYWPTAGDPSTEAAVQRYMQAPAEQGAPGWATAAIGGLVLGTIAYRRPRAAAFFVGAATLLAAPYLGFMVVTVNRFSKFASKLVATVEGMDATGFAGGESGWAGGGGGGGSDDAGEWK